MLSPEALRAADDALIVRVAAACRRLHAGPPFRDRFDMFALQRRYLALVQERGFRLPPRYLEHDRRCGRSSGPWRCGRSRSSRVTTTCWPRT